MEEEEGEKISYNFARLAKGVPRLGAQVRGPRPGHYSSTPFISKAKSTFRTKALSLVLSKLKRNFLNKSLVFYSMGKRPL